MDDYKLLFDRICAVYPDIDLSNATVNTDGLVNIAVINGNRVYRFARNEDAVKDLLHEAAVLNLVSARVTLPVPSFEQIAPDFVTYTFIPGEPLFRNTILKLPEVDQVQIARQLAGFLRELHTIPQDTLREHPIHNSGGRQTQTQWMALYETVREVLFPLMYRSTRSWVDQHFAPLLQNPNWLNFDPALIHDDLAQYHILYDSSASRINGIIDFGTAGIGDPARDYGILINVYGESFVQRMAQFDARIASLIDRARFYAGTLELEWVLGGIRFSSNDWFTAHLDRARDVQPYGLPL